MDISENRIEPKGDESKSNLFIGIDLSPTDEESSGITVIDTFDANGKIIFSGHLKSDEEILTLIRLVTHNCRSCLVAINSPLIANEESYKRSVDVDLSSIFRQYKAANTVHNRRILKNKDRKGIRSFNFARTFKSLGFLLDPNIEAFENSRRAVEVYPESSMVALWGLKQVLPFKNKSNRSIDTRIKAYYEFIKQIESLRFANPRLAIDWDELNIDYKYLLANEMVSELEKQLTSIVSAYVIFKAWCFPELIQVFGDAKRGCILNPRLQF